MRDFVLLDTGPLGIVTHPSTRPETAEAIAWLKSLLNAGVVVCIPSVCDYELRRKLLHIRSLASLARLDNLATRLDYLPISDSVLRAAAVLWAQARQRGKLTADEKELDVDVILAAQARSLMRSDARVVIATTNVGHLSWFADARHWRDVRVP